MMLSATEIKKKVGYLAADFIQSGMKVGIGTGTTAFWFIQALGEKCKAGLEINAVATSAASKKQAQELGIALTDLNEIDQLDITVDGADEIAPDLSLIKGGGGALLQEKMVAAASKKLVIIADHRKLVTHLGAFPLPVEVVPFGWKQVQKTIQHEKNIICSQRVKEGKPFLTDQKHFILDCFFNQISDPAALQSWLNNIPGVVENGLFIHMAHTALIGHPDGNVKIISGR